MHPIIPWLTESRRAYLYRLGAALAGLMLVAGLVGPDDLDAWLEVLGAALGLGSSALAAAHTRRG